MGNYCSAGKKRARFSNSASNRGFESCSNISFPLDLVITLDLFPGVLQIEGSSGFKSKNPGDDKQRILDHYHIELNNPMTILQQEEAKNFFKLQDPSSLYNFYERGSMLSLIQLKNKNAMTEIETFNNGIQVILR